VTAGEIILPLGDQHLAGDYQFLLDLVMIHWTFSRGVFRLSAWMV
jgi:hypothetical protein